MLFVIVDEEEGYLNGVTHYFQGCFKQYFDIWGFQTKEAVLEFARKKKREITVFLGSIYLTAKEITELGIKQYIYLSTREDISEVNLGEDRITDVIYKYQPAEVLLKEFIRVCKYNTSFLSCNVTAPVSLYGVYSPIGRCGKTSLALVMGRILAEEKRTWYMNLEEWSGFREILGEYQGLDVSDLIYYSKQGKQNLGMYINGMLQDIHGLKILPPAKYAPDIQEITREEFLTLLEAVKATGEVDTVIIDFGHSTKLVLEVLEQLKWLYVPVLKDSISQAKHKEFLEFLECSQYKAYTEKIIECKGLAGGKQEVRDINGLYGGSFGSYVRELIQQER